MDYRQSAFVRHIVADSRQRSGARAVALLALLLIASALSLFFGALAQPGQELLVVVGAHRSG
jgi:hypothetical protein